MSERHDSHGGKGGEDFEKWLQGFMGRFEEEEMKALGFEGPFEAAGDAGERPSKTAKGISDSSHPSANEIQKGAENPSSECGSFVEGEDPEEETEPDGRESERPVFSYLDENDDEDEDEEGFTREELEKLFERARPKRDDDGIRTPDEIPEITEMLGSEDEDEDELIPLDEGDEEGIEEIPLDELFFEDVDEPEDEAIRLFCGDDDGSGDEATAGSLLPDEDSDMEERLRHLWEDALNYCPDAVYTIAIYTIRGYHMKRSVAEGVALLGVSASLGSDDGLKALSEIDEEGRVTQDVYHDGIIIYAEPSSRDIKIKGAARDALGWACFRVSLAYLTGNILFRSTEKAENWEIKAQEHGCFMLRAYEDLEHKYGIKCDSLARALERAEDAARGEKERKMLQRVCDELYDALLDVKDSVFMLFVTPEFMGEYAELDNRHEMACHCLEIKMADAEDVLRETGGDDGE